MTSREMFENAHVEKFGVWYAGIHFVDGKYCPSTASIPLKVSEEVTARYEMFTAGFHSRDELLREVLELTDTTKRELYRQTPVRALLTLAVLGNKLQTALKEE